MAKHELCGCAWFLVDDERKGKVGRPFPVIAIAPGGQVEIEFCSPREPSKLLLFTFAKGAEQWCDLLGLKYGDPPQWVRGFYPYRAKPVIELGGLGGTIAPNTPFVLVAKNRSKA